MIRVSVCTKIVSLCISDIKLSYTYVMAHLKRFRNRTKACIFDFCDADYTAGSLRCLRLYSILCNVHGEGESVAGFTRSSLRFVIFLDWLKPIPFAWVVMLPCQFSHVFDCYVIPITLFKVAELGVNSHPRVPVMGCVCIYSCCFLRLVTLK